MVFEVRHINIIIYINGDLKDNVDLPIVDLKYSQTGVLSKLFFLIFRWVRMLEKKILSYSITVYIMKSFLWIHLTYTHT